MAFNFGQPSTLPQTLPQTSTTGFSFGTPAPSFGAAVTSTAFGTPSVPSFGSSAPSFGVTQAAPAFNFGEPASSAPSFGLQTSQPSLFGSTQAATQPAQLPLTSTATAVVSRGLGGEGASGEASSNNKSPKDQVVPPEIREIVQNLKTFIKDQKTIRDENAQEKYSLQSIVNISTEIDEQMKVHLSRLDVQLQKNGKIVEKLKEETQQLFVDGENASRAVKQDNSQDYGSFILGQNRYIATPATHAYFTRLVKEFEETMLSYTKQIKELEAHLDNMDKAVNPQELILVVRKQHDSLIALAAEIYAVRDEIEKNPNIRSFVSNVGSSDSPSASSMPQHQMINLNRESEKKPLDDKQITKPIAFPTFHFEPKSANPSTPKGSPLVSSDVVLTSNLTMPPLGSSMLAANPGYHQPQSSSNLMFSSPSNGGNMSFGSPASPLSSNTFIQDRSFSRF